MYFQGGVCLLGVTTARVSALHTPPGRTMGLAFTDGKNTYEIGEYLTKAGKHVSLATNLWVYKMAMFNSLLKGMSF